MEKLTKKQAIIDAIDEKNDSEKMSEHEETRELYNLIYGGKNTTDSERKIVLSDSYTGFYMNEHARKTLGIGIDENIEDRNMREDARLIFATENGWVDGATVARIPKDATDFIIHDYDGIESVYYVLNGRIYIA